MHAHRYGLDTKNAFPNICLNHNVLWSFELLKTDQYQKASTQISLR